MEMVTTQFSMRIVEDFVSRLRETMTRPMRNDNK